MSILSFSCFDWSSAKLIWICYCRWRSQFETIFINKYFCKKKKNMKNSSKFGNRKKYKFQKNPAIWIRNLGTTVGGWNMVNLKYEHMLKSKQKSMRNSTRDSKVNLIMIILGFHTSLPCRTILVMNKHKMKWYL